ncbi:uncharacterized protein LOC112553697 [Pomacea canaliculata]|uniref:uncharacterized protein LOC112553697 n=1 Tax=Pomacea canaliculata TaxID=400727 RepID=UPI000D72F682|nr:uncharacterized protein LOC112553697 [Pomacea canaliculata]
MDGKNLNFGAVTALKGVTRAISVARSVMEKSPHSMLTGNGAVDFAIEQGFQIDSTLVHHSDEVGLSLATKGEMICKSNIQQQTAGHDTLGLIVLDTYGNIGAGVSTSGMTGKARGRVGDSALPGSGLYADNEVGAVCCSGDGDQIMKFCPSFHVLQFLKQGQSPEEACQNVVKNMVRRVGSPSSVEIGIIAVNSLGEVGAATTVREWVDSQTGQTYPGFPFTVWHPTQPSANPQIHVAEQIYI